MPWERKSGGYGLSQDDENEIEFFEEFDE